MGWTEEITGGWEQPWTSWAKCARVLTLSCPMIHGCLCAARVHFWQMHRLLLSLLENHNESCNLCAVPWLFILATGRSGSTTIFGAVNRLDTVQLEGESDGAIGAAMQMYDLMNYRANVTKGPHAKSGFLPPSRLECGIQSLFSSRRLPSSTGAFGFKELVPKILLAAGHESDHEWLSSIAKYSQGTFHYGIDEMMTFFERVFPCAHYLFNTREDVTAQSNSSFWHPVQQNALPYLRKTNLELFKWHTRIGPNRSLWLSLTSNGFNMKLIENIPSWLGLAHSTQCRIIMQSHATDSMSNTQVNKSASVHSSTSRWKCKPPL